MTLHLPSLESWLWGSANILLGSIDFDARDGKKTSLPHKTGKIMALTQMQIIQSLGEAMAWFERELSWDVPPTELRHLCGRIGELYAALITNGQMATEVNQKGYDVVSGDGERISVKTTAKMKNTGHISFNPNTLDVVDRIMILRVNTEDMQVETLLNTPKTEAKALMVPGGNGKLNLALSKLTQVKKSREDISSVERG